jgi:hypothetical protein
VVGRKTLALATAGTHSSLCLSFRPSFFHDTTDECVHAVTHMAFGAVEFCR